MIIHFFFLYLTLSIVICLSWSLFYFLLGSLDYSPQLIFNVATDTVNYLIWGVVGYAAESPKIFPHVNFVLVDCRFPFKTNIYYS
jgi:hypothetical protein